MIDQELDALFTGKFKKLEELRIRRLSVWSAEATSRSTSARCPVHNVALAVDVERSLSESNWNDATLVEFAAMFKPCRVCNLDRALLAWGVPRNMIHCTLHNYKPDHDSQTRALEATRQIVKQSGFVVMACQHGERSESSFGIGKTHLAIGAMRELYPVRSMLITQAEFLTALRARYDSTTNVDICARMKHVNGVLVLDDAGLSTGGRDEVPKLHEILSARFGEQLRTIITTNLKLAEFLNMVGPRMADRLSEAAIAMVEMEGRSHRKERRNDYVTNTNNALGHRS